MIDNKVWISMEVQEPYFDDPTYLEVIYKDLKNPWMPRPDWLKDGDITRVCWWWDHPYCSLLFKEEISFWRMIK